MSTKTEAVITDLYHVPENRKAEIIDGEVILMSPTGKRPIVRVLKFVCDCMNKKKRPG